MGALVYFRRKGETTQRELGLQDMKELPPRGRDVTIEVDGKLARAWVLDRREFVSRKHRTPRALNLDLDGRLAKETRPRSFHGPAVAVLDCPVNVILVTAAGVGLT
jgi:hypothetical protein